MTSHTVPLTFEEVEKLRNVLKDRDFDFEVKPYTRFAAKKGKLNVTVYEKGPKVLIQGKETEDFVRFILEPEVTGIAKIGYDEILEPDQFEPHFGIDESGKGDYFGPLVIAGAYTDATIARRLIDAGVMDSKRIGSNARIRKLAAAIRAIPGCSTVVISIGPERYNEMFASFRNLNRLLAWGHARAIESLVAARPDCPRTLSDQFARPEILQRALKERGLTLQLEQRTKGESDPAVAAASILARERFIDWMGKASGAGGILLPLGASAGVVDSARALVARDGPDILRKVAKLHFKTTAAVMQIPPPNEVDSSS